MQAVTQWIRNHISLLAFVVVVVGLGGCGIWAFSQPKATVEPAFVGELGAIEPLAEAEQIAPTETPSIVVYISGEVRAPDVYSLPADARIKDLVVAAGGLTDEADPDRINLAEKLIDAQHVRVPPRGATGASESADASVSSDSTTTSKINLNTASADDLEALPGIGAALAQRIIDYRTEKGPLAQIEDLQNIKGIGGAVYDKIVPLVTVGS